MRIKLLKIKEYKNLKDLKIKFIDENIDVFIGNNGSGKTNIYEFILKVFQKVAQRDNSFEYEFVIEYDIDINGKFSNIVLYGDGEKINIKIDGNLPKYNTLIKNYMPKNIVVYYSGNSTRLQSIYSDRFIYMKDEYFPLVFTTLLTSNLEKNRKFLKDFFHIIAQDNVELSFKVKNYFKLDLYLKQEIIKSYEQEELERYYEIEQYMANKLDEISFYSHLESYWSEIENQFNFKITAQKKTRIDFIRNLMKYANKDISLTNDNKYITFTITTQQIIEDSLDRYDIEFFKLLFGTYKGNLLQIEDIRFNREDIQDKISYRDLSEGETQFILTQGIIELFNDNENLFLLDEADTYLHPLWQREIINHLRESKADNIHILFTTHSPQTLTKVTKNNIYIIKNSSEKTNIFNPPKSTFGRDINSIVSEAMGIPERPKEIDDLFNKLFQKISQKKFDEVEQIKQQILKITANEENFVNDELDFVKANAIIQRMKVLGK